MRPSLLPGALSHLAQNLNINRDLKMFELSKVYDFRSNNLPDERSMLAVAWLGEKFYEAKGLAESLFDLMGIPFGDYGSLGQVNQQLLNKLDTTTPVTLLILDFAKMVKHASNQKQYRQIPKNQPVIEDLTFVLPPQTPVGQVISAIKTISSLIHKVKLLDRYGNAVTFNVSYLNPESPLTSQDIQKLRSSVVKTITHKFNAHLKGQINWSEGSGQIP